MIKLIQEIVLNRKGRVIVDFESSTDSVVITLGFKTDDGRVVSCDRRFSADALRDAYFPDVLVNCVAEELLDAID